jgi:formylglycine-generating enzyme required for sulfatase activity
LLDWGQGKALDAIDAELAGKPARVKPADAGKTRPDVGAGWYVNGQGQTMVIIQGPVEFRMGSHDYDPTNRVSADERPHVRRIPRNFAISAAPVNVGQYRRFLQDNPDAAHALNKRVSPEDGCPMVQLNYFEAARYCNWLSAQEGIPKDQWCYPEKMGPGLKLSADLSRTGYRLPTEAEWEYACRAGSGQGRHFGSPDALLPRYSYNLGNSDVRTWPHGRKRPNDLGLVDVNGNVFTWCDGSPSTYPLRRSAAPAEDRLGAAIVDDAGNRIFRGASYGDLPITARASYRLMAQPGWFSDGIGLRVGRTVPAVERPR